MTGGTGATAHLLHGFLGAGKTTFARRLERELPAVRFTHDEWMAALYGADPPAAEFPALADRVFALMETVWTQLLRCGVDVILDFGFFSRASRDAARARVAELGARSRLYSLTCDESIARERCRARNLTLAGGLYIADATFDLLKARFEPLGADEPHEHIETDQLCALL